MPTKSDMFYNPRWFTEEQTREMESPRGRLLFASCRSGTNLAKKVFNKYREQLRKAGVDDKISNLFDVDGVFSDSETRVRLGEPVSGCDVYLFQALRDPTSDRSVNENYMAFLIAARAFRENGARHVVAILPYLAYARQDKPTRFEREPTTARLMADLAIEAGVDRLVTWEPHSAQIRGFYGSMSVNTLESLTFFGNEFKNLKGDNTIVVAPDVGASKLVTHFADFVRINYAIASKERLNDGKVVIKEIVGDFENKTSAIILDDMISTGGSIKELIEKLIERKKVKEFHIGVSHNLCIDKAYDRLWPFKQEGLIKKIITTNSIPQTAKFRKLVEVRDLSDILCRTINRIHYSKSVSEVFYPFNDAKKPTRQKKE
ncbi:hypothetical protein DRQ36_05235 [bacterium]|nr:MAG: hypothetical protein DRQ36_05235 [bacterium]